MCWLLCCRAASDCTIKTESSTTQLAQTKGYATQHNKMTSNPHNDTCPYPINKESNSSIISQFKVLSNSQTFHLVKTNPHRIGHEAQLLRKVVDPSNFLPLWHKAPKREEKKKDQHLLVISLDVSPINIITSCSSPSTTITIIVVGVNTCMALMVSGGGVASGTSGTPRLLSLMVTLQCLILIYCSSLLLLIII